MAGWINNRMDRSKTLEKHVGCERVYTWDNLERSFHRSDESIIGISEAN